MVRSILHCDLNGFYASVECLFRPELKTVPMAVCGNVENRHGIILAKNEIAKKYGIVTAETVWQAKKKCPDLVLVPPHHDRYAEYSKIVNQIYNRYTDMVEPFGIDESWLDVTGTLCLFGSGKEIADQIRATVKNETGLTVSVGVSFNKIFAKLGSDYKKPDATTVINRENYKEIVFPLPVTELLYVGKAAAAALAKLGIRTIGDLASSDRRLISAKLGHAGETIHDYANGLDDSPVQYVSEKREVKSVGNGLTFKRNLIGIEDIKAGILAFSDIVASRLREYGLKCYTIQVTIKDPKFKSISRQKRLVTPTFLQKVISDTAIDIIKGSWNMDEPIRMLTITAMNLVAADACEQVSLFQDNQQTEKLEKTIDAIRNKYGTGAIKLGTNMKNDIGLGGHDKEGDQNNPD